MPIASRERRLLAIPLAALFLGGCVSTPEIENTIAAPGTDLKYSFKAVIPMVRPSTWKPKELIEAARELSAEHYTANIVFGFERGSEIPRLDPSSPNPVSDAWWLRSIKRSSRWENGIGLDRGTTTWSFDPGTTAHVYLRRGGVGADYLGRVSYMKAGRELGFRAIGGNGNLVNYYRDMADLGIYIP